MQRAKLSPQTLHPRREPESCRSIRANRNHGSNTEAISARAGRCGGPTEDRTSRGIHVRRKGHPVRSTRAISRAYRGRSRTGREWKHPVSKAAPNAPVRNGSAAALAVRKSAVRPALRALAIATAITVGEMSIPTDRKPCLWSQMVLLPLPQPTSRTETPRGIHCSRTAFTSQGEGWGEYQGIRR